MYSNLRTSRTARSAQTAGKNSMSAYVEYTKRITNTHTHTHTHTQLGGAQASMNMVPLLMKRVTIMFSTLRMRSLEYKESLTREVGLIIINLTTSLHSLLYCSRFLRALHQNVVSSYLFDDSVEDYIVVGSAISNTSFRVDTFAPL